MENICCSWTAIFTLFRKVAGRDAGHRAAPGGRYCRTTPCFAETAKIQDGGWIPRAEQPRSDPGTTKWNWPRPGYMGRAVCDQHVGAVQRLRTSHSCIRFRRFRRLQRDRFSAVQRGTLTSAFGFRKRVPDHLDAYSMLVHYGGYRPTSVGKTPSRALEDVIASRPNVKAFCKDGSPCSPATPDTIETLSLVEPFQARSHRAPIVWDTNFTIARGSWASR